MSAKQAVHSVRSSGLNKSESLSPAAGPGLNWKRPRFQFECPFPIGNAPVSNSSQAGPLKAPNTHKDKAPESLSPAPVSDSSQAGPLKCRETPLLMIREYGLVLETFPMQPRRVSNSGRLSFQFGPTRLPIQSGLFPIGNLRVSNSIPQGFQFGPNAFPIGCFQ